MTSKIKVDNIENQCGGAVVTKCGATTTISGSVVKADDIQAADGGNLINQCGTTITLGASGDTINLASGASQTGFGRTGTVDWDTTAKTASFTAVSGNGYFCDTTSSAFTATLPAGSAGDIVSFADYAGTWQTNGVTVTPNGTDKIGGVNVSVPLSIEGQSVTFVYVDSTQGWLNTMDSTSNVRGTAFICASVSGACNTLVTVDTDYKVATFTGPGTFTINSGGGILAKVDYLVVAGGGGAGSIIAGGGGAGGYRESHCATTSGPYTASPLASTTSLGPFSPGGIPITVGGGGAGSTPPGPTGDGVKGSDSIFSTITSTGGGNSQNASSGASPALGQPGGSGGGGGRRGRAAGNGNTPPVSPPQGNPGGAGGGPGYAPDSEGSGGGGGGAGAAGGTGAPPNNGGAGGAGVTSSINGTPTARAGGGGGGVYEPGTAGTGGTGGGGAGGPGTAPAVAGTDNTGGGGGGAGYPTGTDNGAAGGSGIVIIRYKFQ
jgi:hypothetical protein